MKKLFTFILALLAVFSVPLNAHALDVPQERSDCSIEFIVRYEDKDLNDGTLTAIKVGYVDHEDGNYFFRQEITGTKLEDIASSSACKAQEEFYNNNKETHNFYTQTQSVKNGKATFTGLSTGLYLIIQEEPAHGFSKMDAFLVSVPYLENGEYNYHVKAVLKSELEREPEPTEPPPTEPDGKLPQTGQLNWPIPLLVVSGLAFLIFGWVLCFGKKRDEYEN